LHYVTITDLWINPKTCMTHKPFLGPVMIDIEGLTLTNEEKEKINHPNTGAIILFSRNYTDPEQIENLIKEIRKVRQGSILIAVDQEGGRVQRFQNQLTRLPPASTYQNQPQATFEAGWLMAAELLSLGVDFSFAPVLDVDRGVSDIIGNRSFANDAMKVSDLASRFMLGMQEAGMAATGKHFPGHGAVALDSHLTLPIDNRSLQDIEKEDLLPFQILIRQGLQAVMTAHVEYPQVDALPASFSEIWLKTILRHKLGFHGVIFSDDLNMEGAVKIGAPLQRAELALKAGCDMILMCNNPSAASQILEQLPIKNDPVRETRLQAMIGKCPCSRSELLQSSSWRSARNKMGQLPC
jgi:beta-N-acetylhexosaminidase